MPIFVSPGGRTAAALPLLAALAATVAWSPASAAVTITLDPAAARGMTALGLEVPVVGRAFFIVSRDDDEEPRLGTGVTGNPLWGVDVRGFAAGDSVRIVDGGDSVRGYPLERLDALPHARYCIDCKRKEESAA